MTPSSDVDADDVGFVVVSFTVIAARPIDGLVRYLRESRTPDGEFFYDLGTETFEELEAENRADRLDAAINGMLDLVEHVPRSMFHDPHVFVRLYLTFGRGAETVSADALRRMADVNATMWIDS
ncbi:hypothetical protein ACI7YT_13795 [Microbacterium sp. M]|uniref:hypothetical protein n=1 Tax=Microbacterium sp. M TaxID=3377125 RepID=UPI00386AEB14